MRDGQTLVSFHADRNVGFGKGMRFYIDCVSSEGIPKFIQAGSWVVFFSTSTVAKTLQGNHVLLKLVTCWARKPKPKPNPFLARENPNLAEKESQNQECAHPLLLVPRLEYKQ